MAFNKCQECGRAFFTDTCECGWKPSVARRPVQIKPRYQSKGWNPKDAATVRGMMFWEKGGKVWEKIPQTMKDKFAALGGYKPKTNLIGEGHILPMDKCDAQEIEDEERAAIQNEYGTYDIFGRAR